MFPEDPPIEIAKVILSYNMVDVGVLQEQKEELLKKKASIIHYRHSNGYYEPGMTLSQINIEIDRLQKEID